jgi:hypothetical protein
MPSITQGLEATTSSNLPSNTAAAAQADQADQTDQVPNLQGTQHLQGAADAPAAASGIAVAGTAAEAAATKSAALTPTAQPTPAKRAVRRPTAAKRAAPTAAGASLLANLPPLRLKPGPKARPTRVGASEPVAAKPASSKPVALKQPRKAAVVATRLPASAAAPLAQAAVKPAKTVKLAKAVKAVQAVKPVKAVQAVKPAKAVKPGVSAQTAGKDKTKTNRKASDLAASKPVTVATKPAAAAPDAKLQRAKEKLVRDSFTMPQADFSLIHQLKERAIGFKRATKKSELLRAGLHALANLSDAQLQAQLGKLAAIKAGRPKKAA